MKGYNLVGFTESKKGITAIQAVAAATQQPLSGEFVLATIEEINEAVQKAEAAFTIYRKKTAEEKALFLETIADEIMAIGDMLIERAMQESGLPEARLQGERGRTTGQLRLFAQVLREGSWVEAVIDTALPDRKPLPRSDIRKMLMPVGPVLVFGASNFPFAFSTAGGDTVSALAAGNPVIVKAHEGHLGTNELMATAIKTAAQKCGMPDGVFSCIINNDVDTIQQLVIHEGIKAIGFTGSYSAGMAIYNAAATKRKTPIPVYAEMGSINPVLVLPQKLQADPGTVAKQLAASVTLGVGQFCTNPGLILLPLNESSDTFINTLGDTLQQTVPATMLNQGVCRNYYRTKRTLQQQQGVNIIAAVPDAETESKGASVLLQVNAAAFIANETLQTEVFGPATLIVTWNTKEELKNLLSVLHGQLTGTVLATDEDIVVYTDEIEQLTMKIGRLLYNGVPTGVEVGHAMVHGGPFPATTIAAGTSVGADAIKRFVRPVCWQDCPQQFLPEALKDNNPLKIMRKVNGVYTVKA